MEIIQMRRRKKMKRRRKRARGAEERGFVVGDDALGVAEGKRVGNCNGPTASQPNLKKRTKKWKPCLCNLR